MALAGAVVAAAGLAAAPAAHASTISPTYTCTGADDGTTTMLGMLGDSSSLAIQPTITMDGVGPAIPAGEAVNPQFNFGLELEPSLTDQVIAFGVTEGRVSGFEIRIDPHAGVTGEPLVVHPPDRTMTLVAGQPIAVSEGPFGGGSFTRTDGDSVAFAAGQVKLTLGVEFNGSPVNLNMICQASGDTIMSVVQEGGAAEVLSEEVARGDEAPAAAAPADAGPPPASELASTGNNWELTLAAFVAFGLGIAVLNEATLRRKRVTVRSR